MRLLGFNTASIPTWGWWAIGAGGLGVLWWASSSSSSDAMTDAEVAQAGSGGMTGAYPSLTYAAPAALGGGPTGLVGANGTTDALSALMEAFGGPSAAELTAQLGAQVETTKMTSGVTVFQSLVKYLNQHKGLHNIQAVVPGVGTVSVGPTPKAAAAPKQTWADYLGTHPKYAKAHPGQVKFVEAHPTWSAKHWYGTTFPKTTAASDTKH